MKINQDLQKWWYRPQVSANKGFGFDIGPKPKEWFRSFTTWDNDLVAAPAIVRECPRKNKSYKSFNSIANCIFCKSLANLLNICEAKLTIWVAYDDSEKQFWMENSLLVILILLTMVFCYQNCSDLLREKIVLVIKKNFWGWRPRVCEKFWDHLNNLFKQWKVRTISGNRMLF